MILSKPESVEAKALSYVFGSFRPSDRLRLLEIMADSGKAGVVVKAFEIYLEGWATADWFEAYLVERIGLWLSIQSPEELTVQFKKMIRPKLRKKGTSRHLVYSTALKSLETRPADERSNAEAISPA